MSVDLAPPPAAPRPRPAPTTLVPLASWAARLPALMRAVTTVHVALVVGTGGRVLTRWFGLPVLVLETVGRRSGHRRRAPLVYLRDGANLVVVAANGGVDRHPDWWLNLRADAHAVAVIGGHRHRVAARSLSDAEHRRLWRRMATVLPIETYQRRTARPLPVVVLAPEPGDGALA